MYRFITSFVILSLSVFFVFPQNSQIIPLSQSKNHFKTEVKSDYSLRIKTSLKKIHAQKYTNEYGSYSVLSIEGTTAPSNIGEAGLPIFSRLIEVPHKAEIKIIINSYNEEVINLNDYGLDIIMPVQPSYSKSTPPEDIVFIKNSDYYNTNTFEKNDLIKSEIYGIMRGVRIGRIEIRPYHYNPVENTLIVYNDLDFEIHFDGADLLLTETEKAKQFIPQFQGTHNKLINYKPPASTKDGLSNYTAPVKYVIVANPVFESTLEPFVEWKTMKGFNVIEAYTDETGSTNTEIQEYLQNLYDVATPEDPAPLYLLIIGDHTGNYSIPAFASTATTPSSNHVTDLYFVCFDGEDDYFPDMYYGRISATSTQQLQNALDKIIPYEKYTFPSGDFLDRAMLIAGTDNFYASSHGDATIYYAVDNYYNTESGYEEVFAYYYSLSDGPEHVMFTQSNSAEASASVRSRFAEGIGFANYSAHCLWDRWGDPLVNNTHINNFDNKDEYPFMIGNCCQSMRFNANDAFGEILLYTADAGAVGYIGASNDSYWTEDVYWGIGLTSIGITTANVKNHNYDNTGLGIYDGIWHTHEEPYEDWYYSGAQINIRGNMEVQASSSSYKKYYWEIYHLSGDPSLVPYNRKPEQLEMTYFTPVIGSTSLTVNTEPYAYIAISRNGKLLDAKWSGNENSVTLNFETLSDEPLNIVGTKQDRIPVIDENIIPVLPMPPVANFEADTTKACDELSVQFTDLSINYPTSWVWDFGDGNESTEQNPAHTYTSQGFYTVSLTVSNNEDNDTLERIDYIQIGKTPVFTVNTIHASGEFVDDGAASVDIIEGNHPFTVIWSTTDTGESVENLLPGDYSVMVEDTFICMATQDFLIEWITDIKIINENNYIIYPNPAEQYLYIKSNNSIADKIEIINLSGIIMKTIIPDSDNIKIDISGLEEGVYIIRFIEKDTEYSEKILLYRSARINF